MHADYSSAILSILIHEKYILKAAANMTAKEFFYLVSELRETQKRYFESRDRKTFLAARALENAVDSEIRRVKKELGEL